MRPFFAARAGLWLPLLLLLWLPISAAYAQTPVALAGADRTICSGLGTTLGDNNPIPGLTYRWTPATGLNNATIHNPRATISNTTPAPIGRTYTLTVTDASGATATDSVRVTVLPRPFIDAGFDQTICSGQTITVGSPALPGHSYAWTADPFLSNPSIAQPTYTPINPSGASFFRDLVLIVRGPNGCDATARIRITVNPAIVAAAGPNQTTCSGQTLTLGAPAVAGYSYSWHPTTGLDNPNAAQPILTTANAGAFPVAMLYTLTVNANGCTDSSRVTITVFPGVVAEAGAAVAVCAGQTATLAAGQTPVPGTTYRWAPATGLSNPNILNPTVNLSTPGTFTYTLTATGTTPGAVCSASDSVAVTVDALPTPQAAPTPGAPVELCAGATALLGGGAAVPGLTYQWRPLTGLATPTAATTTVSLPNPTNSPIIAVYTLTATSAAGCADSSQVTVRVNPLAVADAGPNVTVCAAQPVTLGTVALPGYTYSWAPRTGLNFPTLAQPVLTMANTTAAPLTLTYYVTVTLPSGTCAALDSVTVTVEPTPTVAAISGPAFVCDFGQAATYSVPATPGATVQWTVTGGTLTAGQGTAHATVQFAPGAATYAVEAVPTSGSGCGGAPVVLPVRVDTPALLPTLASVEPASNTQITLGFTAPGSANTPTQVQVFRRIAGQGSFAVVGTASPAAGTFTDATAVDAAANSYEYRLELTNGCGALLTGPLMQTIRLTAQADASGGAALSWNAYVGFPVQEYRIYRSLDGAPAALLTTVSGTTLQAAIPSGMGGGGGFQHEFRIVAVNPDALPLLANSNTATVAFANAVSPFNIITPNGDGLNETLVFDNLRFYPNSSLRIYNRWGRQLLDTPDYRNDWGAAAEIAPGTYYYLLQLPNGTSTRGWVEVVK